MSLVVRLPLLSHFISVTCKLKAEWTERRKILLDRFIFEITSVCSSFFHEQEKIHHLSGGKGVSTVAESYQRPSVYSHAQNSWRQLLLLTSIDQYRGRFFLNSSYSLHLGQKQFISPPELTEHTLSLIKHRPRNTQINNEPLSLKLEWFITWISF